MYVRALTLDVLLGDVRSLKAKRGVVRPLVAELRRRYPGVAVAETGHLDLHRRAEIGVAVVSATAANALRCSASASAWWPGTRDRAAVGPAAALQRRGVTEHGRREGAQAGRPDRQIVAEMLERRIKDPRLGFVTVTEARLTGDLREATVFYTVYGTDAERPTPPPRCTAPPASSGPRSAGRPACGTPRRSTFVADALPEAPAHRGTGRARPGTPTPSWPAVREGASYAGDPDPYRKPADDTDDGDE